MTTERHTVVMRTLCFIFNDKNEILFLERAAEKFDAGMFNVLGGHVEKGEDIIESANREIFEESGVIPDKTILSGIIHVSDFFGKNILLFITKSITNTSTFKDSIEGKLQWVSTADVFNYKIYDDIKPILKNLLSSDKKFIGTSLFDGKDKLLSISLNPLE